MTVARFAGLALLVFIALAPFPAGAHALKLFVTVEGQTLVGQAYFGQGRAPAGASVRVTDPNGALLAETQTDANGAFRVAVQGAVDHVVAVNAGDGHARTVTVPATDLAGTAPAPSPSSAPSPSLSPPPPESLDVLLSRKLRPLEGRLAELEDRLWLRDILGGLGYIVGLTGVVAWASVWRARKKHPLTTTPLLRDEGE